MSTKTIKEKAKQVIDRLSEGRVKLILDFIEYLDEKESWEATKDILSDKGMMEDIRKADEDLKAGRMDQFVSWDEVKKADV